MEKCPTSSASSSCKPIAATASAHAQVVHFQWAAAADVTAVVAAAAAVVANSGELTTLA